MVKTIHLVRHGHHALLAGVLCGRLPGVELDELGCHQMSVCAVSLFPPPTAVQSSPQQRALQSASILARHHGLAVETVAAVDEIDVGEWSGRSFDALNRDPDWHRWNNRRGSSRPPDGESMLCLQRRVVQHLEQLRDDAGDGTIAIVSHAEPIRAALLHYADIALDQFLSITVDPASVSTLCFDRRGVHISRINQRVAV
ncbi:MAG: histidine phosphatase family protein [Bradyrhizobium sp.]|nr:histidine phosphatase family protein [Bradyrhizobium sp.]